MRTHSRAVSVLSALHASEEFQFLQCWPRRQNPPQAPGGPPLGPFLVYRSPDHDARDMRNELEPVSQCAAIPRVSQDCH